MLDFGDGRGRIGRADSDKKEGRESKARNGPKTPLECSRPFDGIPLVAETLTQGRPSV
jgi:hypothetical protein